MSRLFVILFLTCSSILHAQDVVYDHLYNNDQLPTAVYYDIVEDHNYNIWLASGNGLVKYDGDQFITYTNEKQRAITVFNLTLDQDGILWCNNLYGQIFYVKNDQLQLFYDARDLTGGQLSPFQVKEASVQLFTRSNGIFSINRKSKLVEKISSKLTLSATTGSDTTQLLSLNPPQDDFSIDLIDNDAITSITTINLSNVIAPMITRFQEELLVHYMLNNENKIILIDAQNRKTPLKVPQELRTNRIYNIKVINDQLWFCTNDGVWRYTINKNTLNNPLHLLKSQSISSIVKDFNGNLWATSLDNGLFIVSDINKRRFTLENPKEKVTASYPLGSNKTVVATSLGGIYLYENPLSFSKKYQLKNSNFIEYLYYDTQYKKLIISGIGNDSYTLDLNNGQLVEHDLLYNSAKSITRLNDTLLFYGNFKEALFYKNSDDKSQVYTIRQQRVKEALVIDNNRIIISFIDGTYMYDARHHSLVELTHKNASIYSNSLTIKQDELWIATKSGTFLISDKDDLGSRFRESVITQSPNNESAIYNNIQADGSYLWMLSNGNLTRYDPEHDKLKMISNGNSFSEVVNDYIITDEDVITFSSKSIYRIPKNILDKRNRTAPITITGVKLKEMSLPIDSLYRLNYDENEIQINFNSTGYGAGEMKYEYILNKDEDTWRKVPSTLKQLDFASLSPGEYRFKLRGKHSSSLEYQYAIPITIIIEPPYWLSYWFIILMVAIVILMVYFLMKYQQRKRNKRRRLEVQQLLNEKKLASLKLENIRSQMNPHFVFNSLNSIQDFIVSNERELASGYLVKFSRLIRMYLDYSQQDEISLTQEINALKLYLELEKMRFDDELNYTISIDPAINADQFRVPSLFIQPYVENALKHGLLHKKDERQLAISGILSSSKEYVKIIIEDNGIGRLKSSEINKTRSSDHQSFATSVNDKRVQLYKEQLNKQISIDIEDLYDQNKTPAGTRVTIALPLI